MILDRDVELDTKKDILMKLGLGIGLLKKNI